MKNYIAPAIKVADIELQSIICDSYVVDPNVSVTEQLAGQRDIIGDDITFEGTTDAPLFDWK